MSELAFQENERVLAFHGPLIYEAKVIHAENWTGDDNEDGQRGPHYFVHYKGWKATWDEWVPDSRVMKLNDENKEKQKRLRESHEVKSKSDAASGPSKDTSTSTSNKRKAPEGNSSRAQKRGRDSTSTPAPHSTAVETEEEWVKRPEIKLDVPDLLKVQLVDDWEAVTKNAQLVPLPRTVTVDALLDDFLKQYKGTKVCVDLMREVCAGLKLYFSKCLGNNLLYRFERIQYADYASKDVGSVYGAEHLLRLFVNLPELLAHTTMDSESLKVLREALHEILGWLAKHHRKYFLAPLEAYENTSPAYQNLAKA